MGLWQSKQTIPGVVYSEDWTPPAERDFQGWRGAMYHVSPEKLPQRMQETLDVKKEVSRAGPEDSPYTFWERIGATPIAAARIRPRQYYMPTTDFRQYSYDDQSPEEVKLRAAWMARMYDFGWSYPATVFCICSAMCVPLPFRVRLPMMASVSITVVFLEFQRVYTNAAREKEELDDFLVAKEIWYIKNVEVRELGIETLPHGMTGMQAIQQRQDEVDDMNAAHVRVMQEGMMMTPAAAAAAAAAAARAQAQDGKPVPGLHSGPTEDGKLYMGEPGELRSGQKNIQRYSMIRVNRDKFMPDVPL